MQAGYVEMLGNNAELAMERIDQYFPDLRTRTRLAGKHPPLKTAEYEQAVQLADELDLGPLLAAPTREGVEDEALTGEAEALAEKLANGPTLALGLMKRNIRAGLESDFTATLLMEAQGQREAGMNQDSMEGAMSFLQKRKPAFKGA